jgi:hypothetical protein
LELEDSFTAKLILRPRPEGELLSTTSIVEHIQKLSVT